MEKSYLHAFTKFWVCKLLSDNMFLLLRKEIKERIHKYFTKTYNHFWEHAFNIQGASPQFWDKTSTKFICKFSDALIQKFCFFFFFKFMHYKYIYIKSYIGFYQGEEILLSDMHQITPEVNI